MSSNKEAGAGEGAANPNDAPLPPQLFEEESQWHGASQDQFDAEYENVKRRRRSSTKTRQKNSRLSKENEFKLGKANELYVAGRHTEALQRAKEIRSAAPSSFVPLNMMVLWQLLTPADYC